MTPEPNHSGVIFFYGDRVLVLGRCGCFLISGTVFALFARILPGITANQLCAWLWRLRVEWTGLNYSVLHGMN
jgi:hypothetical protein